MDDNVFRADTATPRKKDFLKQIRIVLVVAIFLTGISALVGMIGIFNGIRESLWNEIGMAFFAWKILLSVSTLIIFIGLLKIAVDKKPFSKTLTWSIRIIGFLFVFASFMIPRLSGYQTSGFELFSSGSFVLIDGVIFVPGLVMIILGSIIMAGFTMQKEMDEIL